jgi:Ca-activated chloride channel family protein
MTMRKRTFSRKIVAAVIIAFIGYRAVAHPAYQNLYTRDARAKPELRTDCTICHAPDGRATDPNFLSDFGRAFKRAGNKITPEMRDRFSNLFVPADQPVESLGGETIKFETSQVAINIIVSNPRGEFIRGLDREAFTILEDGRPQEILQLQSDDAPLALAVVLDTSGSTLGKDMERWRNAIGDLADRLHDHDALALYTFGEQGVERKRDFSSSIGDLDAILKDVKGSGGSPLYDAILQAVTDLRARSERRRAILLFTDGSDSGSKATLRETEQGTFQAGISIYAVDLINRSKSSRGMPTRQAAAQALETLSAETGGRYLTPPDGFSLWGDRAKMKKVFSELVDELHSQYTVVYEPSNGRRTGRWRAIRIEMEQADLTARTRLGYREGRQ